MPPPEQWTKIATVDQLKEGEMIGVTAGGVEICLAFIGGQYYAINNICSHFFTLLSDGELYPDALEVQCPLHDSRFSLLSGEPTSEPADKPVASYVTKADGNDILIGL